MDESKPDGGTEKRVLITGGAGFIGSHLADELLARGYAVRVLDCLHPQVHEDGVRPSYLHPEVELITGDVRDPAAVEKALENIDYVYHFAARVGVGQSMYEICDYSNTNVMGTAVLLEALGKRPVEKLIVASSMSVYGEGLYNDGSGRPVAPDARNEVSMRSGIWDFVDDDGETLTPVATHEGKSCAPSSIYALGKYDQERMCLIAGHAYQYPVVAMRFFNVFGPRQALSNPYTGVLAIFASRLLNKTPPQIFEDGLQRRDFVHVTDVARACRLALERPEADGHVINVGSGRMRTILEVAESLGRVLGRSDSGYELTGRFRVGDVRHCFADISLARNLLGYEPRVAFEAGLEELAGWLEGQIAIDRFDGMQSELVSRGLAR